MRNDESCAFQLTKTLSRKYHAGVNKELKIGVAIQVSLKKGKTILGKTINLTMYL